MPLRAGALEAGKDRCGGKNHHKDDTLLKERFERFIYKMAVEGSK